MLTKFFLAQVTGQADGEEGDGHWTSVDGCTGNRIRPNFLNLLNLLNLLNFPRLG